jgi:hypothetical protein
MPRPPRADEAGGLYHALNRGNLRADIFKKEGDFAAFDEQSNGSGLFDVAPIEVHSGFDVPGSESDAETTACR